MINVIETNKILGIRSRQTAMNADSDGVTDSSIVLTVDGAIFRFDNVDDFSAAIEGRTAIPTSLYNSLAQYTADELTLLAETLKQEEKKLIELLERALTSPDVLAIEINRIPLNSLRSDHYWRDIIVSLSDLDADESFLQTAIVKYLQFLNSYQEVVRLLYALKVNQHGARQTRESSEVESAPYETALFDVLQYSDAGRMVNPFRRLPQGEAVTLHALPGHAIELLLAKYSFELVNRNGWALVDSRNRHYKLQNDLNYVGRGARK